MTNSQFSSTLRLSTECHSNSPDGPPTCRWDRTSFHHGEVPLRSGKVYKKPMCSWIDCKASYEPTKTRQYVYIYTHVYVACINIHIIMHMSMQDFNMHIWIYVLYIHIYTYTDRNIWYVLQDEILPTTCCHNQAACIVYIYKGMYDFCVT